jgi:hypothetical protein
LSDLIRKLIEWAYFKYVVDHALREEYEVVFEPDHDHVLDAYSLIDFSEFIQPVFSTEVEAAMYEKKFHTLH